MRESFVLSDRCELNDALAVFRAGADGYLFEQISRDALIKSLDLVMLGVTVLPAAIMRVVGEDHEMVSDDDPAVPASRRMSPYLSHAMEIVTTGDDDFPLSYARRTQQNYRTSICNNRSDRQSPHQGDPSEDLRPQSHSGGCLGAQSFLGFDEYRTRSYRQRVKRKDAVTIASKAQHRAKGDARTIFNYRGDSRLDLLRSCRANR